MRKFLPIAILAPALAPVLTGCGFDPLSGAAVASNVAMGGATVVSYSVVGQSPVDYALSEYRQKNCDIRNPKRYGHYCVDPPAPLVEPAVYCYHTLGTPDCSSMIDPHNNGQQPIVGPGYLPYTAGQTAQPVKYDSAPTALVPPPPAMPVSNDTLTESDNDLKPAHGALPAQSETDPVKRGDFK